MERKEETMLKLKGGEMFKQSPMMHRRSYSDSEILTYRVPYFLRTESDDDSLFDFEIDFEDLLPSPELDGPGVEGNPQEKKQKRATSETDVSLWKLDHDIESLEAEIEAHQANISALSSQVQYEETRRMELVKENDEIREMLEFFDIKITNQEAEFKALMKERESLLAQNYMNKHSGGK